MWCRTYDVEFWLDFFELLLDFAFYQSIVGYNNEENVWCFQPMLKYLIMAWTTQVG